MDEGEWGSCKWCLSGRGEVDKEDKEDKVVCFLVAIVDSLMQKNV